jgi:hypothetical protein
LTLSEQDFLRRSQRGEQTHFERSSTHLISNRIGYIIDLIEASG